jgi:pyrimidine deaminase RibD-like protein
VLQRGPAEQARLRDVGWAHAGLAAFALDAFDHRRLFAADVGARAPTQLDVGQRARRVGQQRVQLALQQAAAVVVLVAQIEVDGLGAHHLRGDQHAFEEAVRVALQVETVLEGAGLAFVDVDGHQARGGLLAHDAPLAPRREACAPQAAQAACSSACITASASCSPFTTAAARL